MTKLNQVKIVTIVIIALAFIILLMSSLFIVNETEQVIITQFGKPIGGAIDDPGVHFKLPFIQKVHFFEKRYLEWDGAPNQIPTKDKRFICSEIGTEGSKRPYLGFAAANILVLALRVAIIPAFAILTVPCSIIS